MECNIIMICMSGWVAFGLAISSITSKQWIFYPKEVGNITKQASEGLFVGQISNEDFNDFNIGMLQLHLILLENCDARITVQYL